MVKFAYKERILYKLFAFDDLLRHNVLMDTWFWDLITCCKSKLFCRELTVTMIWTSRCVKISGHWCLSHLTFMLLSGGKGYNELCCRLLWNFPRDVHILWRLLCASCFFDLHYNQTWMAAQSKWCINAQDCGSFCDIFCIYSWIKYIL